MIEMRAVRPGEGPVIDAYGSDGFRINGVVYRGPVLVLSEGEVLPWGGLEDVARIACQAGRFEVLILGAGERMVPVPDALQTLAAREGFGIESMATPAACRSYNVLLGEARRVAAALIPVMPVGERPEATG